MINHFETHARRAYQAAKAGKSELAERELWLMMQPLIKEDERRAVGIVDTFAKPNFPATNRQSGAFVGRRATTPAARHWVSVQQRSG